jgi:hypothetical protein
MAAWDSCRGARRRAAGMRRLSERATGVAANAGLAPPLPPLPLPSGGDPWPAGRRGLYFSRAFLRALALHWRILGAWGYWLGDGWALAVRWLGRAPSGCASIGCASVGCALIGWALAGPGALWLCMGWLGALWVWIDLGWGRDAERHRALPLHSMGTAEATRWGHSGRGVLAPRWLCCGWPWRVVSWRQHLPPCASPLPPPWKRARPLARCLLGLGGWAAGTWLMHALATG